MRKKLMVSFLSVLLLVTALISCVCVSACAGKADKTEYVLTFDSQGGTVISSCKNVAETEPIPVKDGYKFCGWYITSNCNGERLEFPYTIKEDQKVYAKWERTVEGEKKELIQYVKSHGKKDGNKYVIISQTSSSNVILEYVFGYDNQSDMFVIYGSYAYLSGSSNRKRVVFYTNLTFKYNQLENGLSVLNEVGYDYKFTGDTSFTRTNTNLYSIDVKKRDANSLSLSFTPNTNNNYTDLTQNEETEMLTTIFNDAYEFANDKAKSLGLNLK